MQHRRLTKWLRLAGTCGGHLAESPTQAGSPRASCPAPCPDGFWVLPRTEIVQRPWVTCSSARSPSHWKTVSWCTGRMPCVSVCAHYLLCCHLAPRKRAWVCLLYTFPSASYIQTPLRLLQAEQSQLFQTPLMWEKLQFPAEQNHTLSLSGLFWFSCSFSLLFLWPPCWIK